MEALTTIRRLMAGNKICVPAYQRAYSWDTNVDSSLGIGQTNEFLDDLEVHARSKSVGAYYFGHFLFEQRNQIFSVIDGQQRLTTIVIMLSALFRKLRSVRSLTEDEEVCYEDMVRRRSVIRFSTVDYDNQLFIDYVIEKSKVDRNGIETESARRIVAAFDFFTAQFAAKPLDYLTTILQVVSEALCTTHLVSNESEAIQMFIFQNNRGKRPSNLEIIKAKFMHAAHLFGGEAAPELIVELKNRFEKIYKAISKIEHRTSEDDVLLHTLRVHFNSLWESNSLERVNKCISKTDPKENIFFIKAFTQSLTISFENLSQFYTKDEREVFAVHSLVALGGTSVALPFILKAYRFNLPMKDVCALCSAFESLVLRNRLIGTRAEINSRINDVFASFVHDNCDLSPIICRIEKLKTSTDWWWAHWNNDRFRESLQGGINHSSARFLLWKYEIFLEQKGNSGYSPSRFDRIVKPELEHIAPTTEPDIRPHGYDVYDQDFISQHLDCLGNYLLLSKSHNCAVGNVRLSAKLATYVHNEQQREVARLAAENGVWDRSVITARKARIVDAILSRF